MKTTYESDRLILRVCTAAQAGMVTDFYNNNFEDFSQYEPLFPQAHTVSYHKKNLQYEYDLFMSGQFVRYYIFEKQNPISIIGTVSYRDITHSYYDTCTIGYKIDKSKRRKGYAKEAILLSNGKMFKEEKMNRIEATVRPENVASMRLLESIGYVNEGLLREKIKIDDVFLDHYLFALLKRDYNPNPQRTENPLP